ncbi:hypothetical protein D9Q98_007427 [Chlorella vulgaris]|uniref:Uncharacterized protein n=1 Tax=Chlorella vulgaris TaxID=3077 RepID=A0A9D4TL72_CHLVU|nr:hypothetical protein D9Q98_007427 [Chlorella vulgaris]
MLRQGGAKYPFPGSGVQTVYSNVLCIAHPAAPTSIQFTQHSCSDAWPNHVLSLPLIMTCPVCKDNCQCGDNCTCGPECTCCKKADTCPKCADNCECGDNCNCGPECTCCPKKK